MTIDWDWHSLMLETPNMPSTASRRPSNKHKELEWSSTSLFRVRQLGDFVGPLLSASQEPGDTSVSRFHSLWYIRIMSTTHRYKPELVWGAQRLSLVSIMSEGACVTVLTKGQIVGLLVSTSSLKSLFRLTGDQLMAEAGFLSISLDLIVLHL